MGCQSGHADGVSRYALAVLPNPTRAPSFYAVGYTDGFLDGLRRAGDPSTDVVIEELARTEQVRAVGDVLRTLTYNDQPVPAELPPSIGRWLEQHGELPDWVDRDRLERGCTVIVELGPQACVALATASLVYCYLLGDEVCALVGLPRSRWDRAITWQAGVGRVLDRAQSARGPVGSLTKMVGAGILTQRVVGMAGRHSASFSIPVPPELERRWTASGVFPRIEPELIEIARAEQA